MHVLYSILDILFPPRATEVVMRRVSQTELKNKMQVRRVHSGVTALFSYTSADVRTCIVESKFFDNRRAQRLLGHALTEWLRVFARAQAEMNGVYTPKAVVCIPMPLSPERMKERGYNQVARVVQQAAKHLRHDCGAVKMRIDTNILVRTRNTAPQTSLGRDARRTNVAGAFAVTVPVVPHNIYVLVDDVVTTGATMQEGAAALRAAGARHIYCVALTHQSRTTTARFDDMY